MVEQVSPTEPLPPLSAIPAEIGSLFAYEVRARAHLPVASWRHIQSGAGEERTLAENRAAFARCKLLPRVLRDLRGGDTAIELLGQRHAAPILIGPVAYHRLVHPEGELATVRAAAAMGVGMVVSTLSSFTLEEIASAGRDAAQALQRPDPRLWFQLYLQEQRERSLALVRRAEAAGYEAIMVTVDASVKRSDFMLPPGVDAANLRDLPPRPQTSAPGDAILFGTPLLDNAPRWEDLAWLREVTMLPLAIKGVLAPEDALRAVALGYDAVGVSNHGGRVLDGVPSALEMLPGIAEAAPVPLLVDGGVRAGTDIVKAIALGASAVMIGRPQLHGLAVAGVAGAAHVLHLLRGELELAMAQLGCARIADISRELLIA